MNYSKKCKNLIEEDIFKIYLRIKQSKELSLYECKSGTCLVKTADMAPTAHSENVKKNYIFKKIFGPTCTQNEIFDEVVKDNINKLNNGQNTNLLVYGAPGSGKAHTMLGTEGEQGLVPRVLGYIFTIIKGAATPLLMPSANGTKYLDSNQQEDKLKWLEILRARHKSAPITDIYCRESVGVDGATSSNMHLANKPNSYVWVSYVEVIQENIYDLLTGDGAKLYTRRSSSENYYVEGVFQAFVRTAQEAYAVMMAGRQNRMGAPTGSHADSRHSTHSHLIFTITVVTEIDGGRSVTTQMRLCELASSEREAAAENCSARTAEFPCSLGELARCLRMLNDRRYPDIGEETDRDSSLIRLLRRGLSGARNESLSVLVTMNAAHEIEDDSILDAFSSFYTINDTETGPTDNPSEADEDQSGSTGATGSFSRSNVVYRSRRRLFTSSSANKSKATKGPAGPNP